MAESYVKFVRGSLDNYKLIQKNEDTLYFVYNEDESTTALYLGTRLIAGTGEIVGASNLNELNDVFISAVAGKDILMYNEENSRWENITFEALLDLIKDSFKINEKNFEYIDGALSLLGFKDAEAGSQLVKGEDGSVSWVKPDTTTVEGLSTAITSLQNTTADHEARIAKLEEDVPVIAEDVGELNSSVSALQSDNELIKSTLESVQEDINEQSGKITNLENVVVEKANIADVYTKTETENKINEAIVSADHLRRIIVDSTDDINVNAENALRYIYMVANGLEEDDNKYYEYIVIEAEDGTRSIERVGSWEVNLSDYATKTEVNEALALKADASALTALTGEVDSIKATVSNHNSEISTIKDSLNNKADASALTALEELVNNAKTDISTNASAITTLQNLMAEKADKSVVESLTTDLNTLTGKVNKNVEDITVLQETVQNIADTLNQNYATKVEVNEIKTDLQIIKEAMTWQTI